MRVFAAKVMGGVIVPESSEELPEGTTVSVVANDGETIFTAPPADEAALIEALEDPAEAIPSDDVLDHLR
jgi:hypothetical protein